jgi:hypothetical protein
MEAETDDRDLYSGMIRLHILHHAGCQAIFGAGIAEELAWHGYKTCTGTLYPIIHGLEKRGVERSGFVSLTPSCHSVLLQQRRRALRPRLQLILRTIHALASRTRSPPLFRASRPVQVAMYTRRLRPPALSLFYISHHAVQERIHRGCAPVCIRGDSSQF